MGKLGVFFVGFLSVFIFEVVAASSNVPVLVWESTKGDESHESDLVSALPAVTSDQLSSSLDALASDVLIMFVMNRFSVEDLSGSPDAFPALKQHFESSDHAFLPAVSEPAALPGLMTSHHVVRVAPGDVSDLRLAPGQKTLLVVEVEEREEGGRRAALKDTDQLIASVIDKVKTQTDSYAAVLTAKHSKIVSEHHRVARSLMAEEGAADPAAADPYQFHNLTCIFIYTSGSPVISVMVPSDNSMVSFPLMNVTSATSDCNVTSSTQTATLKWDQSGKGTDGDTISAVEVVLTFENREPHGVKSWNMSATLKFTGGAGKTKGQGGTFNLDVAEVTTPLAFSYHCSSRNWLTERDANSNKTAVLMLPGLQVQPLLLGATQFGRAWDCTGFFTVPILSGLFLSTILLVIFVWALGMIASVPTMDRFDDPRGKPLHVPASE